MATSNRRLDLNLWQKAWSFLNEYHDFRVMANYRKKIEEQLQNANIPLTYVPWKKLCSALLCHSLFNENQLKEMKGHTDDCCTMDDISSSQTVMRLFLEDDQEDETNLTETWFEINELKERFQKAMRILPSSRKRRREILHKILGYPTGYAEDQENDYFAEDTEESSDLSNILSIEKQNELRTGDLIEFSGNRLHDAFYIYRLPEKGLWSQIKQMWSEHTIKHFKFNDDKTNFNEEEEIILVPAMDEYGYGVPYIFATTPNELLPDGVCYKYIDINCPFVAKHKENPTIALVQKHLEERLKNPVYHDSYMNVEMNVKPDHFPQEYVACVQTNLMKEGNILWTQRRHYDGKQVSRDLNDNFEIFVSRRILECEEQYRQRKH